MSAISGSCTCRGLGNQMPGSKHAARAVNLAQSSRTGWLGSQFEEFGQFVPVLPRVFPQIVLPCV